MNLNVLKLCLQPVNFMRISSTSFYMSFPCLESGGAEQKKITLVAVKCCNPCGKYEWNASVGGSCSGAIAMRAKRDFLDLSFGCNFPLDGGKYGMSFMESFASF